ncbi:hypothetical protein B0H15DRAFT_798863 [Mycena belliarum]|uniref:Uncharacterized protein n=1 Tax=Mycena belliarum TaxID=1033014 RepID=A0AAD6UA53_9AGAR|nr:hypothetical protein B0H15DRAFT_798863 [Mycena belliae]
MGRESPFSPLQKQHIEALFPVLLQQPANGITDWIQREADSLLALDPFKTLPSDGLTRLKRKLRNYYDRHQTCQCFSFAPTGIVLFELERQVVIATAAAERATATKTSFSVAYAVCTQEMWQVLGAAEQAEFEAKARSLPRGIGSCITYQSIESLPTDASRNQIGFTGRMHDIPDMASQSTVIIPRDPPGVPLFPDVDWENQTTANLSNILALYLNRLWEYFFADGSRLPWDAIAAEPNVYYDVSRFVLPVPLREPKLLTVAEVGPLAHYFATTSDPFVFREKLNTQPEEPGVINGKSGEGSDSGQSSASDEATSIKAPNLEASNVPSKASPKNSHISSYFKVKRERPIRVVAARPTVAELGRGSGNKPTYAYQIVNANNEVVGEVDS